MKQKFRLALIIITVAGFVLSAILSYITIDRQRRFEAFARGNIQLLMDELSVTNVKMSSLRTELDKTQAERIQDEIALKGNSSPFGQKKCQERAKEKTK